MKKNNKQFVRNVIIGSVVGLIVLMIGLFITIQNYLGNQDGQGTYIDEAQNETSMPTVELSENIVILVEKISDNHIMGYDIHNKKTFSKVIDSTVKISDAYGNVLPIAEIKEGDLVEVDYQSNKDKVIAVSKSSDTQNWKKISGITVDTEGKKINIAGISYAYQDELLVLDAQGKESSIKKVGPFDVVSIQAMDDIIWSITIDKASASLNLSELPTSNGQIEIGNTRLLPFKSVTEPIKLIPGDYKIVIKMKGYKTIVEDITVEPGEVYEMSLKDAEIAYTTIQPLLSAKITNYTISVGDKVYKPGEEIKVQQGEYKVSVVAEGYEKWTRNVSLEKDVYKLNIAMIPIEEEKDEEADSSASPDTSGTATNNTIALNNSRTITINSDPTGANVYIDGAFKGTTPYTVTLNDGTYGILLEKTDYDVYSTNILLDGSNDQTSFLYQMVPRSN